MNALESPDGLARKGAVLAFRPELRTLVVTGSDRLSWLQGLVTSNVVGLPAHVGSWGLALTKPGKIVSDVLVVSEGERVFLGVPEVSAQKVHEWLAHHLIMEDVDIADASKSHEWALVVGPGAVEAASKLVGAHGGAWAQVDLSGLGDVAVVFPRGASKGGVAGESLQVISEEDWQRLRVERAIPLYGVDITNEQNPHDVSLERRAVSWDKGCYLGQEAVCMQDMRGKVKRRLVLVAVDSGAPPAPGTPVLGDAGAVVGETRSAVASRVFGKPVALAVVRVEASEPGTPVTVGGTSAEVVVPR